MNTSKHEKVYYPSIWLTFFHTGLGTNVRNAYNFICQNSSQTCNDEIYLVGFSRGAFTVRCIASLIQDVGILTKPILHNLYKVHKLWKNKRKDTAALETFVEQLERTGSLKRKVNIKACGVWDTVSAMGLQLPAWLPQPSNKPLAHVDEAVPICVENAFLAMALDERRSTFCPLPWSRSHRNVNFRQTWFLGAHADVGGGYEDAGLANVALVWMVAQFLTFTSLGFNIDILLGHLLAPVASSNDRKLDFYWSNRRFDLNLSFSSFASWFAGERG
jgi:uncharacterized protein (DUF2235 family)